AMPSGRLERVQGGTMRILLDEESVAAAQGRLTERELCCTRRRAAEAGGLAYHFTCTPPRVSTSDVLGRTPSRGASLLRGAALRAALSSGERMKACRTCAATHLGLLSPPKPQRRGTEEQSQRNYDSGDGGELHGAAQGRKKSAAEVPALGLGIRLYVGLD